MVVDDMVVVFYGARVCGMEAGGEEWGPALFNDGNTGVWKH
jgi:hypothetical protein